jgi:hypothetical protein
VEAEAAPAPDTLPLAGDEAPVMPDAAGEQPAGSGPEAPIPPQ